MTLASFLFRVALQEDFIRGALAQLEAERDEARRQLEEERRLHIAARHQASVTLSLEQQRHSQTPVNDHEHGHSHGQHSHCEHSHEHSGQKHLCLCNFADLSTTKRLKFSGE